MKHLALLAAFALAMPYAAAAEDASPSVKPAPEVTQPAPQGAEAPPQTPEDRQKASAAKLAGLIRFVGESCKEAKPDYDRFKAVVVAMGVDLDAISKGELLMRSMSYTEAYRKNVEESCRKAVELFGEKGSAIPGLVLRKAS